MSQDFINHSIFELDYQRLAELIDSWGEPKYRTGQIWQGLYSHFYTQTNQFTTLPGGLKEKLSTLFANTSDGQQTSLAKLTPTQTISSQDGTTHKTLFKLEDDRFIETVFMRYKNRRSVCISTQSGCAMGCVFCATGQMGFGRNLSSGEIVEQVIYYATQLAKEGDSITNVVVMGMGEPFHNYEATLAAIYRLNDSQGFNMGTRRFTISTVGLIPMIERFTSEKHQINLAISLHSVDNHARSEMLPINKKYPLDHLLSVCLDYVKTSHRRITFEWALIEGVNDTQSQAIMLSEKLQRFIINNAALCHVNAIPLNPTEGYSGKKSQRSSAETFKKELEQRGIPCTIRIRRGIEIQAGCGQLAGISPRIL